MANKGLEGLGQTIRKLRFQVLDNSQKILKQSAILFDQKVVLETPVDTGRARSNWVVGFNQPNREIVDGGSPKSTKRYQDGKDAKNTITDGQANQIADQQLQMVRAKILAAGKINQIIISNNLPYISRLNDGYSQQAPKNFVPMALRSVLMALAGVKLIEGA